MVSAASAPFEALPLLALGLVGCASTPTYTMADPSAWDPADLPLRLHISEAFDSEEVGRIRDAADLWTDATGGALVFFEVSDDPVADPALPRLEAYLDDRLFGVYRTDKLTELDGLTRWRTYRHDPRRMRNFDIFLRRDRRISRELVAHEMGHALGLTHIERAPAVMRPGWTWGTTNHLSAADIDAINWVYGTDPDAVGPSAEE